LCQGSYAEIPAFLASDTPKEIEENCQKYRRGNTNEADEASNPPAWSAARLTIDNNANYSYWITVYLRINCANALLEYTNQPNHPKVKQFINAHIPVVRYLDSLEDPRDSNLKLPLPYVELGKSHYDNDRNRIDIESCTQYQTRPYPLQVLRKEYPELPWTFEEVLERKLEKTVYMACLYVMTQCKNLHATQKDASIRDSLWFYHGCFIDYMYNYNGEDYMPVELYPFDNRCFTAYDLPSALHVLAGIPLWGEQASPSFPLGKFIQKSLPFAGARRTLIAHTNKIVGTNDAFWKVFSSVFYCMLMDMYPEEMSSSERCFDLNRLFRAKQIASDREMLRVALSQNSPKENDKGCFIVFTAFRMWIVMMTKNQPHFKHVIDWDAFENQTIQMAQSIRESITLDDTDIFKGARQLAKTYKMKVYRYRKSTIIDTMFEKMMESLEKDLYKRIERWKCEKPQHISQAFIDRIDMDIPVDVKTNLLNLLIKIPRTDWLTPICMCIMYIPKYGGIRKETIHVIERIINVYYKSAKPKDFEYELNQFHVPDFKVVCWYFHVIATLNKIDFECLSMEQVVQIDRAMINRYTLFPGQILPAHAYNVFFSICCGKIKTLLGSHEFGHRDIAYDMETNVYVCAKNHKKATSFDADDLAFSEFETQRKNARKQRKEFNHIPCTDNPVLCIPLRGFMLIYNKTERYMHCPSCGAFHQFRWTGYKGGEYACTECTIRNQKLTTTCTVCGLEADEMWPVVDPLAKDVFQHLYFCKRHLSVAKKAPTKEQLYSRRHHRK